MAEIFERVGQEVLFHSQSSTGDTIQQLLRPLDPRARQVLDLFTDQDVIKSSDVARLFGISTCQARLLLSGWVQQSWLETADPSRRGRKYVLAQKYRKIVHSQGW